MKAILFYLRLYVSLASQYFKARMEYRVDFIVSMIGMFFRDCTGFFALQIIFASIGSLGGWSFYEVMFLYSFSLLTLTPLQLFFDKVWDLRDDVASGAFIKYYFRPIDMMFYYMSGVFDIKGLSQLFFAIGGLWYSSCKVGIVWDLSFIIQFAILAASASMVMISMMIFASVPAFWITESFSLIELVFNLREFSRYPLTIFSKPFQWILSCVLPMGFIAYYPVELLLRGQAWHWALFGTPVVGGIMFFAAYRFWKFGVNSWSGTGS